MPTLSYRDVLSQTFDDKELVEFLTDRIADYKNYGAFRVEKLPFHVMVTLIDRVKTLMEQQIAFYGTKGTPVPGSAEGADTFEAENPPAVAYSDPE